MNIDDRKIDKEKNIEHPVLKEIGEWIKTILVAFVVALIITQFIKPALVSGDSMYPTLKNGNFLFMNRRAYKENMPDYGDIIVFNSKLPDGRILIKRVIAVEGDKIVIKDGNVYINDKLLEENYINQEYPVTDGNIEAIVPENTVFVLGDNRGNSLDSRNEYVGFVNIEDIMGKVFVRLIPFTKF